MAYTVPYSVSLFSLYNFNEFSRGGAENIAPAQIRYNIVEHGLMRTQD